MRYLIVLVAVLCINANGDAQTRTTPKFKMNSAGLQIGDTVPDVAFEKVWNYTAPSAHLSDFRGKWLIVDLYATWCTNCLTAMPHLQALRDKFKDQLQVLVVTYEHDTIFQNTRNKVKLLRSSRLPIATGDSLLHQLFPHRGIPHEVWIDPQGVVRAITAADQVTAANVEAMISGKEVALIQKTDLMQYSTHDPLVTGDSEFVYRTLLTKKKGSSSKIYVEETGEKVKRILMLNNSVAAMFYYAAYKGDLGSIMNPKRIYFQTRNVEKWLRPQTFPTSDYITGSHWEEENLYCYETIFPNLILKKEACKYMLDDLNRLFPVKGVLEKRKTACWVIVNRKTKGKPYHNLGDQLKMAWDGGRLLKVEQMPFENLITILNANRVNMDPIVNETGYHGKVTMELNLPVYNSELSITDLRKMLNRYGLDLKQAERMIDQLVIKDK